MTKISRRQLNSEELHGHIDALYSVLTLLYSKEEVRNLIRDLFTHTEIKMSAKRLHIARMLLRDRPYEEIRDQLKVTDQTISTISNILAEKGGGFRLAHDRLNKSEAQKAKHAVKRQRQRENPYLKKNATKDSTG